VAPVPEGPPKPVTAVVAPKVDSAECAVQVRLPDGGTVSRSFASDAPLRDVHAWVAGHTGVPRGFKLGSTFPKTVYQDTGVSLKDLGARPLRVCVVGRFADDAQDWARAASSWCSSREVAVYGNETK
jgi:hypothetical protein